MEAGVDVLLYARVTAVKVENGKIAKVTFSMMKNYVGRDGQISSYPVDRLYPTLTKEKEKKKLEKDIRHLYGRITGKPLTGEMIRKEYEL